MYLQRWHGWCHMKLLSSRRVLCTPYNHAPCHFMQSHIRKVYACLAVTCHLHFWQNDRGLLRATAGTRGWNGYRNESQHRKLTLEKKILPPLLQGFEPATFRSRVRRSNHWAIPAPKMTSFLDLSRYITKVSTFLLLFLMLNLIFNAHPINCKCDYSEAEFTKSQLSKEFFVLFLSSKLSQPLFTLSPSLSSSLSHFSPPPPPPTPTPRPPSLSLSVSVSLSLHSL